MDDGSLKKEFYAEYFMFESKNTCVYQARFESTLYKENLQSFNDKWAFSSWSHSLFSVCN